MVGLLASGFLFALTPLAAAGQRSISFPEFNATVEVGEDASIRVLETIRVQFVGSWNGIFRTIPVNYDSPQGFNYRLFLDVESVTDESGRSLEHWVSEERGYRKIKIRVPGATDAIRTIAIRYTIPNALRYDEEYDELYWNITGDEWQEGIGYATARVVLPDAVSGVRTNVFTGAWGSTRQDATVRELDSEVFFETTQPIGFREGLTIAVAWDRGVVARPGIATKVWWFLRSNFLLFIPLVTGGLFFYAWSVRGRDPKVGTVTTQYEPPEDLRPAELGTLIDNTPHMRDLTATMIDLAVRGYLRLEEIERSGFLTSGTDVRIVRVKPRAEWSGLRAHERKVLDGLFDPAHPDEVTGDALKEEYYAHLHGIKDSIWSYLVKRRFYDERPDKVRAKWIGFAILLTAITGVGGLLLVNRMFLPVLPWIVSVAGTAVATIVFAILMPARTVRGVQALERALGFEEFLSRVDGDRLRRMEARPEMFERLLPFAMALGVEDKWAQAFEGIYREPPEWYRGTHPGRAFHPGVWVGDLGGVTRVASAAMVAAPARSSGGSGFSGGGGGGFSGGGFGGGGGGGW
ncbi:MAG: DUF2207 domain-containing protein [Planctomycetota bacterium]